MNLIDWTVGAINRSIDRTGRVISQVIDTGGELTGQLINTGGTIISGGGAVDPATTTGNITGTAPAVNNPGGATQTQTQATTGGIMDLIKQYGIWIIGGIIAIITGIMLLKKKVNNGKPGRPKGSKNKRAGRPKGSKNKKKSK